MAKAKPKRKVVRPALAADPVPAVEAQGAFMTPRAALTMDETAHRIGVTKAVIRKEIAAGRLAACRIGERRIRITVDALAKYLKERAAAGVYPITSGNRTNHPKRKSRTEVAA